eukprot:gene18298-18560_t
MFGTVLSYVSLRLLGESPDQPHMIAALKFIHSHGGVLYAPSWAKFWLAVIGVFDWKGINSIPAVRNVVIAALVSISSWKVVVPLPNADPILLALRKELYLEKYESIQWDNFRQTCAPLDEYSPLNPVMKVAQDLLSVYENYLLPYFPALQRLREKALLFVIDYIHAEDKQTNYVCIGPVNKAINMLSVWAADQRREGSFVGKPVMISEAFLRHVPRVDDYLWVAEDGMKMQGYNGSQCWDTSFAVQAIVEGGLAEKFPDCAKKVYSYLKRTQIRNNEEDREKYFRHISKGGWPFSTAAHGWPITDCTSEGLKGVLSLHKVPGLIPESERISNGRIQDACDVILSYQNADGGWATYENNRGYRWYEMLNPSEVFGDIMIDYSYVECLVAAGEVLKTSDSLQRAVKFLLSKQNPNGGWGESYLACVNKDYPKDGSGQQLGDHGSGVVQTAWALLALIAAGSEDRAAISRAAIFLIKKQQPDGDWAQEGITGVFNRSCGITYTAYRNIFPLWALSRYAKHFETADL